MKAFKLHKKICHFLWVVLFSLNCFANSNSNYSVTYEIDWQTESFSKKSFMIVTVRFQGGSQGKSLLILPYKWAGKDNLYTHIENLTVEAACVHSTPKPFVKLIEHKPNQWLEISYKINQSFEGEPDYVGEAQSALFQKEYFHFVGRAFFAYPALKKGTPVDFTIYWPKNISGILANSFGIEKPVQKFTTTTREFLRGLYLGGHFKSKMVKSSGGHLMVVLRSHFNFDIHTLTDRLEQMIRAQRMFFQQPEDDFFLVSLIDLAEKTDTFSGMALNNAFFLAIPKDATLEDRFNRLISHEHFHTWNNTTLLKTPKVEKEYYWFTEGFTEYYANLLNLRSGLIDLKQYIKETNEILARYYTSPVQTLENKAIPEAFWKNYQVQKLPYQRGFLLAQNWDIEIRLNSLNRKTLDHPITELLKEGEFRKIDISRIIEVLSPYLVRSPAETIEQNIIQGKMIVPRKDALGPCVTLKEKSAVQFDLGFEAQNSIFKGRIVGLKKDSQAYALGLRNQDEILNLAEKYQNNQRYIEINFIQLGQKKRILITPKPRLQIRLPQYVLDEKKYLNNPKFCLKRFEAIDLKN